MAASFLTYFGSSYTHYISPLVKDNNLPSAQQQQQTHKYVEVSSLVGNT
jgi:hypothetical protein